MVSVDPQGNTLSPRPSSATGIIGNYLPVTLKSHSSQKPSE